MSERLSDVEQHALLAVWRLGDRAWGANIRDELAKVTGRRLSISAIYVTLVRLEKRGHHEKLVGRKILESLYQVALLHDSIV